jgi:hypothetical protein
VPPGRHPEQEGWRSWRTLHAPTAVGHPVPIRVGKMMRQRYIGVLWRLHHPFRHGR